MAFQFVLNNATEGELVVQDTPINWESLSKKWKRSEELDGITRTFSQDVEFRGDGAAYLETVFDNEGIDGLVNVQVFEYVPDLFGYELLYTGLINFENYTLKTKDNFTVVQTNFYEQGFDQNLISNLDTPVDLQRLVTRTGQPITPYTNETEQIPLHSLLLSRTYEAETVADTFAQFFQLGKKFDEDFNHFFWIPIGLDNVIKDQIDDTFTYPLTISEINPVEVLKAVHRLTEAGEYTFDIDLNYDLSMVGDAGNDQVTFARIEVVFSVNGSETILDTQTFSGSVQNYTITNISASLAALTLTLNPEDRVYFFIRCEFDFNATGPLDDKFELGNFTVTVNSCDFKTSALTEFPATDCEGVLMYEAFNRIVESVTDEPDKIRSDFFGRFDSEPRTYPVDGEGAPELLTNGYQIRQFPLADTASAVGRPIIANFRDLFQSQNVKHNLGAGIIEESGERVLRIEEKAFFWQQEIILELGCVRDFEQTVDPQSHYNTIKIGYEAFGAPDESVDGLDEFNSIREYTTDLQRVRNDLDLISPYVLSGYRTEFKRRKPFSEEDLEDSKGDAENFIILLRRQAGNDFETDRNQAFSVVNGVTDPDSIYNLRASPARSLRKWGNIISIGLQKLASKIVRYASGEGNFGVESQLTTEATPIFENQDFDADVDFEAPLYAPRQYMFTHPLNREQAALIDANPYGIVQFFDNKNVRRQGFILEVDWTVRDKEANFKLQEVATVINP